MVNSISSITGSSLLQQIQAATQGQDSNFGNFIIALLNKDFDKIDADGDGKITRKELKAFFTQLFQKQTQAGQETPNVDDLVNAIFSKLDPNKTGSIDKNTLMSALQKIADNLFDKIDTNQDGKIDKDELKAFLSKLNKNHKHGKTDKAPNIDDLVNQIFSDLDPNNTGYIDKSSLTGSNSQNLLQILMGKR